MEPIRGNLRTRAGSGTTKSQAVRGFNTVVTRPGVFTRAARRWPAGPRPRADVPATPRDGREVTPGGDRAPARAQSANCPPNRLRGKVPAAPRRVAHSDLECGGVSAQSTNRHKHAHWTTHNSHSHTRHRYAMSMTFDHEVEDVDRVCRFQGRRLRVACSAMRIEWRLRWRCDGGAHRHTPRGIDTRSTRRDRHGAHQIEDRLTWRPPDRRDRHGAHQIEDRPREGGTPPSKRSSKRLPKPTARAYGTPQAQAARQH